MLKLVLDIATKRMKFKYKVFDSLKEEVFWKKGGFYQIHEYPVEKTIYEIHYQRVQLTVPREFQIIDLHY